MYGLLCLGLLVKMVVCQRKLRYFSYGLRMLLSLQVLVQKEKVYMIMEYKQAIYYICFSYFLVIMFILCY